MENATSIKSVQKALALLDHLALGDLARQGVALSALAQACGLPQNTAHNLLKSLVAAGYVAQPRRGLYVAGPKCAQLGRLTPCADPLLQGRMVAALQRFSASEGEGIICSVLVNGERVTIAAVESTQAVRVAQAIIEEIHFFEKATGRLLAAMATEYELQQILARQGWPGVHWDGIADMPALQAALADLRARQYCLIDAAADGLVALAVPVPDAAGAAWGVLGAYAPAYRCPADRRQQLLVRLRALAAELSGTIAHTYISGGAPCR
jgi:IclR family acetate operon transcriptional repressor